MSNSKVAFIPRVASTATVSATSTSSDETISTAGSAVLITNLGPNTAFVRWGEGAQTAVATDMPLLAGMSIICTKRDGTDDTVAGICASGETATVYFTPGDGQ